MADVYTELFVKNVNQEKFRKWFDKKANASVYYGPAVNGGFGAEIEGGWGYCFWEAISFMMVEKFEGIVFDGCNQVDFGDHLVKTSFACDGKTVELERTLDFPDYGDEEEYVDADDGWCEIIEMENDIPYAVTFSVSDIITCAKIYKELDKKLKDKTLVESICSKYGMTTDKLNQFATILNFKKR